MHILKTGNLVTGRCAAGIQAEEGCPPEFHAVGSSLRDPENTTHHDFMLLFKKKKPAGPERQDRDMGIPFNSQNAKLAIYPRSQDPNHACPGNVPRRFHSAFPLEVFFFFSPLPRKCLITGLSVELSLCHFGQKYTCNDSRL